MKKLIAGGTAALFLVITLSVNAAPPTNFGGTWLLDKSKSKGVPSQLSDVESYTLVVTQDEKEITTDTKITRKEEAPTNSAGGGQPSGGGAGGQTSGPGGGGGMRRPRMAMGPMTFKLDGTETTVETSGPRPGTSKLKAEWKENGKALELSTVRTFTGREGAFSAKELWSLSDDGKTLTIQRTGDSPQGPITYTLVFNKQ